MLQLFRLRLPDHFMIGAPPTTSSRRADEQAGRRASDLARSKRDSASGHNSTLRRALLARADRGTCTQWSQAGSRRRPMLCSGPRPRIRVSAIPSLVCVCGLVCARAPSFFGAARALVMDLQPELLPCSQLPSCKGSATV